MSAYRSSFEANYQRAEALERELARYRKLHKRDEERVKELEATLSNIEVLSEIFRQSAEDGGSALKGTIDGLSQRVKAAMETLSQERAQQRETIDALRETVRRLSAQDTPDGTAEPDHPEDKAVALIAVVIIGLILMSLVTC